MKGFFIIIFLKIKCAMNHMKIIPVLLSGLILLSACKKDSNKNNNTTPTSAYYFIGTVNGSSANWEASSSGLSWAVGSSGALPDNQGEISGGITALLTYFPGEQPQLGIEFKTFDKKPDDDATTVFNSFVTTGSWAFSNTLDYTIGNKSVVVYYVDPNGKAYNSIGSQTGSSLNVISATPTTGDAFNADPGMKIKFSLNCTLYPVSGNGGPITITNAQGTLFLDDML